MSKVLNWKVCVEIGLNHLGNKNILEEIKSFIPLKKNIALTIQIREEEFYLKNKNFILQKKHYHNLIEYCKEHDISFGLSIGNIDLAKYSDLIEQTKFLKVLSIASSNVTFVKKLSLTYNRPIFYSTGLLSFKNIDKILKPLIKSSDFLIHTSFNHETERQNLLRLPNLSKKKYNVAYGLHCSESKIIGVAIGLGASKVFFYTGNKKYSLPDFDHSIDLSDLMDYTNFLQNCYLSLKDNGSFRQKNSLKFL